MSFYWFARIMEYLGTLAFAVSGALVGLKKHMDPFGVMVLGLSTATAGGLIRDLVLGITPPSMFRNPIYSVMAIAVSLLVFLPKIRRQIEQKQKYYDMILFVFDTLGLGIFAVMGVRAAYAELPDAGVFLVLFCAFISGCGGGMLRDVLAGQPPYIFSKHIYALAVLAGALVCLLLWQLSMIGSMIAGALVVIAIRLLSSHYRWNLPQA